MRRWFKNLSPEMGEILAAVISLCAFGISWWMFDWNSGPTTQTEILGRQLEFIGGVAVGIYALLIVREITIAAQLRRSTTTVTELKLSVDRLRKFDNRIQQFNTLLDRLSTTNEATQKVAMVAIETAISGFDIFSDRIEFASGRFVAFKAYHDFWASLAVATPTASRSRALLTHSSDIDILSGPDLLINEQQARFCDKGNQIFRILIDRTNGVDLENYLELMKSLQAIGVRTLYLPAREVPPDILREDVCLLTEPRQAMYWTLRDNGSVHKLGFSTDSGFYDARENHWAMLMRIARSYEPSTPAELAEAEAINGFKTKFLRTHGTD